MTVLDDAFQDLPPWARFTVTCKGCGYNQIPRMFKPQPPKQDFRNTYAITCPKCGDVYAAYDTEKGPIK